MFSTPSNPVGCILRSSEFRQLNDSAPADALLVIDEAYHEYAVGAAYPDSCTLLKAQSRPWIVLRTLSKAYGLAGLRIGYGLCSDSELVSLLDRVRTRFNVNCLTPHGVMACELALQRQLLVHRYCEVEPAFSGSVNEKRGYRETVARGSLRYFHPRFL